MMEVKKNRTPQLYKLTLSSLDRTKKTDLAPTRGDGKQESQQPLPAPPAAIGVEDEIV
jgi:hypothetical protein